MSIVFCIVAGIIFLITSIILNIVSRKPIRAFFETILLIIILILIIGWGFGGGKGKEILNGSKRQVEQTLKEDDPFENQKEIIIQLNGSNITINNNIVDSEEQLKEYAKKYYNGTRKFKLNGEEGLYSNYKLVKKVFKELAIPLDEEN
ncbi:MAG: hypothetical protein J6U56_02565 [Spirochaetia bacterium]|nr:hypothetical protein [Spirochaetia bacterium]